MQNSLVTHFNVFLKESSHSPSSSHLFLASFSDGHYSCGSKMVAVSPKPTVSLQCLSPRENIFIDNVNKNPVEISDWSDLGHHL